MDLKQLLKIAGVRNDIAKAVEGKKLTAQQEMEVQEKAMAMTKVMLNEALRAKQSADANKPPSSPKKTIIIPD
jgi:hypothetical protein